MTTAIKDRSHLGGGKTDRPSTGTWCPVVWDWLMDTFAVRSVLDIGCGVGYALEYFAQHGCEIQGIDGCPGKIRKSRVPDAMIEHDYTKGPYYPKEQYDLVYSTEFVEHVDAKYMPHYMVSFAASRHLIVMTHAIPGQTGHHHVNTQEDQYWIREFEAIGWAHREYLTTTMRKLVLKKAKTGSYFVRSGLVFTRFREKRNV